MVMCEKLELYRVDLPFIVSLRFVCYLR